MDDLSSSDTLATEGMRVTLSCHATGNPTPSISWRREDGKSIRVCKERGILRYPNFYATKVIEGT